MRICYFGGYDRDHPRNRVMIAGLEKCGMEVIECHSRHPSKVIRSILLVARYRRVRTRIDVIIVGASCHAYVPIAWVLSRLNRKPLIFDAFVSMYECWEEQTTTNWILGLFAFLLDKISASMSDVVLLDTEEHVTYFCDTFGFSNAKVRSIPVGAYCDMRLPAKTDHRASPFKVVFAGSFLPLHGADVIIQAAELLKDDLDIIIELIGDGEERSQLEHSCNVSNVVFKKPVPYREYLCILSQFDVALGAFGATPKAARVVPCKVYDALMAGVPLITAATPAVSRLLCNRLNAVLIPPRDPIALAKEIRTLKENPALRRLLAQEGRRTFVEIGRPEMVGQRVRCICEEVIARMKKQSASGRYEARSK